MSRKKPPTKAERRNKLYVKFYKQFRSLAVRQMKELQKFYELEDEHKLHSRLKAPPESVS